MNYGQFLRREKQPEALVFACFLKAEDLLCASPGKELSASVKEREASEAHLGKEAVTVRGKLPEYLARAAALPPAALATKPS